MSSASPEIKAYIEEKKRLPAYNKTRELFIQFERSTEKRPPNIKRGRCAKIENYLMDIMLAIDHAEDHMEAPEQRVKDLARAEEILHEVKLEIRILFDLHFIPPTGWSALMLLEDDLAGQLYSWKRETEKRCTK